MVFISDSDIIQCLKCGKSLIILSSQIYINFISIHADPRLSFPMQPKSEDILFLYSVLWEQATGIGIVLRTVGACYWDWDWVCPLCCGSMLLGLD